MSAIIFGVKPNSVLPAPDFRASKSANGGWTASQSYTTKRGALDNAAIRALFPSGARAVDLDPNLEKFFTFLRLVNVDDISNLPGGFVSITCNFAGMQGGETGTVNPEGNLGPTYSLRGTTRSAPLYEHPKWKELEDAERIALGKLLTGEWGWGPDPFDSDGANYTYVPGDPNSAVEPDPITSENGIQFAKRISEGKTYYEGSSFEWSKQWQSNIGIQSAQLNKMGKIANPPGSPPSPGGGRDWMLVSADQVQNGDGDFLYTNQVNFLLSEPGGWDSFLQDD